LYTWEEGLGEGGHFYGRAHSMRLNTKCKTAALRAGQTELCASTYNKPNTVRFLWKQRIYVNVIPELN
jgi:hypothetical protein